jgi:hypothetical protein
MDLSTLLLVEQWQVYIGQAGMLPVHQHLPQCISVPDHLILSAVGRLALYSLFGGLTFFLWFLLHHSSFLKTSLKLLLTLFKSFEGSKLSWL